MGTFDYEDYIKTKKKENSLHFSLVVPSYNEESRIGKMLSSHIDVKRKNRKFKRSMNILFRYFFKYTNIYKYTKPSPLNLSSYL